MKHHEILPSSSMKDKYQLTSDSAPRLKLNPENVPTDLHDLIEIAETWGIGDDIIREDFQSKALEQDKLIFASKLAGRNTRITQWLDMQQGNVAMSNEAAAFMYMQLSLDELGLWSD
jgi:hypothetical protein